MYGGKSEKAGDAKATRGKRPDHRHARAKRVAKTISCGSSACPKHATQSQWRVDNRQQIDENSFVIIHRSEIHL